MTASSRPFAALAVVMLAAACGPELTCTGASSPFANNQSWDLWVCDYDPGGNILGQKPY